MRAHGDKSINPEVATSDAAVQVDLLDVKGLSVMFVSMKINDFHHRGQEMFMFQLIFSQRACFPRFLIFTPRKSANVPSDKNLRASSLLLLFLVMDFAPQQMGRRHMCCNHVHKSWSRSRHSCLRHRASNRYFGCVCRKRSGSVPTQMEGCCFRTAVIPSILLVRLPFLSL